MSIGGVRGGATNKPGNLGIDSRSPGLFVPASSGFVDVLSIPWDHAYWADGPKMKALGYANLAPLVTWPDEMTAGSVLTQTGSPATTAKFITDGGAVWKNKPVCRQSVFVSLGNLNGAFTATVAQPFDLVVIGCQVAAQAGRYFLSDNATNGRRFGMAGEGGNQFELWLGGTRQHVVGAPDLVSHLWRIHATVGNDQLIQDETSTIINANAGDSGFDGFWLWNTPTNSGEGVFDFAFVGIISGALLASQISDLHAWAQTYYNVP